MLPYTCFLDFDASVIWLEHYALIEFLHILLVLRTGNG